jgi:phosphoglycerol transferase MdoB-like AlkP superfamily enzyme
MNWLGVDQYYSEEDIPGYKKLPTHSMGLQDEYVLDFFCKKIGQQQGSFFAVHYNISTHYPYDIPADFSATLPATYTPAMKAMRYYDHSLEKFFNTAKNQSWFSNTTFIFCSDHWLFPQGKKGKYSDLSAYRIPIILYDPAIPAKKIINNPVSHFDILGTVLSLAGYRDSIISYGNNLLDSTGNNQVVFTKANATLYQAIDSSYILGYNSSTGANEFLYNYKQDKGLSKNLVHEPGAQQQLQYLNLKVRAFLQKTKMQSSGALFK